ncbi:hypothetical protein ATPR_2606 [Acetobacter tropicalis NBRC 101654]|uniref:Uncharacterized protein n=1 Tax=Acetobacter tropicalis NBRC 101654 TaxID=749388 RepID=F7VGV7_9PROT|nr:hypothetical protein ATPR_2606 [Acetobacter tropicalis NBRC 101654]
MMVYPLQGAVSGCLRYPLNERGWAPAGLMEQRKKNFRA